MHFWNFLTVTTTKYIRAQYKRAYLGISWIWIYPLVQTAVIGTVFTYILHYEPSWYLLRLYLGLIIWNMFSTSVIQSTGSFVNSRNLIKKATFPVVVIPLSIVITNLISLMAPLILITIYFSSLHDVLSSIFLILPIIAILFLFTFSLSLLFATIYVRVRDLGFIVQGFLQILFYMTPIVYDYGSVPDQWKWVFYVNPLTGVVEFAKAIIFKGSFLPINITIVNLIVIILIAFLSTIVFIKNRPYFDDWI
jgi:lipopolysaccharide transport system permease protein